jgi:hypothetical protein
LLNACCAEPSNQKDLAKKGDFMKYIYSIVAVMVVLSILIGGKLFFFKPPKAVPALIINDKVISREELNRLLGSGLHDQGKKEFLNALITKELLLQQAMAMGIDREASFKRAIQNFYEQSLIKILMDRKIKSMTADISEKEINRYIDLNQKQVRLTVYHYKDFKSARDGVKTEAKNISEPFENLSSDISFRICSLEIGGRTEPIPTDDTFTVYRLDGLDDLQGGKPVPVSREKIKAMLTEQKKEILIQDWVDRLKREAKIEMLKNPSD